MSAFRRSVRLGAVLGMVAGVLFSALLLIASPHVPSGANLLWGPVGGALLGASLAATAVLAWRGLRAATRRAQ